MTGDHEEHNTEHSILRHLPLTKDKIQDRVKKEKY